MSYLLFMDESGHDHRNMPYEVRGGIALQVGKLWPFICAMRDLEVSCFGDYLHRYGKEIKGSKLLDRDRQKWAASVEPMESAARRRHAVSFLNRGTRKESPRRLEFAAYGQACREMAHGLFRLGMNAAVRPEISETFGSWINRLQFSGQGHRAGEVFQSFGIVYVEDPYGS